VGNLGNEVNDDLLSKAFIKYPSFVKAKVVKDKRTNKRCGGGGGGGALAVDAHAVGLGLGLG
jgi:hypothetical protein